jgi:ligand-binding sensor domain-containing protein/two-component sensor histidine kinase
MKATGPRWLGSWQSCLLIAAFLLLGAPPFSTLGATNGFPRYNVRIWQTDDGLPQNSVYAITQTKDGYLWVGTQQGLARFDGMRFVPLDEKGAPELKHGWITALCAARDGSLWIACDASGVTRLKDGVSSHLTEADGLPGSHPTCLLEAQDGAIWIGSEGGLTRYFDGKLTNFSEKNALANNAIKSLCQDRHGVIRAATGRGLRGVDQQGAMSTLNFSLGTRANILKSVCTDQQGRIWVASNEGVACDEEPGKIRYGANEGLPNQITTVVFEDREGRLWAGTYGGLAGLADGKAVSTPLNAAGFEDLIRTIFEDNEENLWVGAEDGLYRLKPARFRTYAKEEGLKNNNAMSVYEDDEATVWIATWGGGINQLKDDRIVAFGSANGLTHDKALALHKGRDGSLWIGMDHGGGVSKLKDGGRGRAVRLPGLIDAAPRVIYEDRQGTVWIGTSRGLNKVTEGKVEAFTTAEGLPGNIILAICEDSEGTIWMGTDSGLMRWRDGKFTIVTAPDGLAHNTVNAIYEDADHALWLGTRGGGLNRLKAGTFTTYTSRQGLFSDEIYEIIEDDFGCFWMSCRNGIFRVRKKDFEDLDRGAVKMVTCVAFGKSDGLASVQCNGVAKPAGWKGKNGRLWFPTIRGVVAVESAIRLNDKPPPVVVEELIVDRKSIPDREWKAAGAEAAPRLRLPPGRGELQIRYTALSFQAPEKNRFKYKLEGWDSDWVDAGTRHEAFYNNLDPKDYRFRVQACNNDGVWNEAGATFALILLPHFWQTWWFKLAVPATFALMFWAWYHARVSRMRALERLRMQIAADLHDDVGSRLTKVAMVTELVERQTIEGDQNKSQIQKIATTTREVIQAMDEIVWTINPKNDTLDNLANYIFQFAQEYFQNTGVRCRLDLPARLPDLPVPTEERHNLFMTFKEALNNVLKHAGATEVRIELAVRADKLVISIVDNGCGFTPNGSHSSGNGLSNMKQRLRHIRGALTLESKPGAGTRVEMEAPLK